MTRNTTEADFFFRPQNFLGQMAQPDLDALLVIAKKQKVAKRQYVFQEGDEGADVYVLVQGRLKLFQSSAQGKDVLMWFISGGEVFGLQSLFRRNTNVKRVCSALACEHSEFLAVPRESFKKFLAARPPISEIVLETYLRRLECLRYRLVNLASDNVAQRFQKLIDSLCYCYGTRRDDGTIKIVIPITHQEIASIIGTTRQTVSAICTQFKSQGMLEIEDQYLVVKCHQKN